MAIGQRSSLSSFAVTFCALVIAICGFMDLLVMPALRNKPAAPKCQLCSCALPANKCAEVCTLEHRQKDTCDMQCKTACMHDNQGKGVYCPKRPQ